jgi:HEAT repeat protein
MSKTDELREALELLTEMSGAIPFSNLYALSDLTGDRLLMFHTVWETLPAELKRRLMHALVELAEASFQVNFDTIFRHCLQDLDDQVRATAIEGLWENEQVGLVGPLITALRSDPSPRVRAAAATSLGRFVLAGELEQIEAAVQARIVQELMTTAHLAGESIEVRRRAIESAAYSCTPDVLQALEIAYYDEDQTMRLSAIVGMGRSCDLSWREIILEELQNPTAAMRYEAALAAGEMMLRAAVPRLGRLLEDADTQVRDAAIWALGQIGGSQAKALLLDLHEEADEETQAVVEEALAEQALYEGDLDFTLYDINPDLDEDLWFDEEDPDNMEWDEELSS